MDTGEPDLLNRLMRTFLCFVPKTNRKLFAFFVNRDGVITVRHIFVQGGIEDFFSPKPAQRTNGVPYTDEVRLTLVTVRFFETSGKYFDCWACCKF